MSLMTEKVYALDGVVEVIYNHTDATYEVWALVPDGPDDCMWDVVETTDDFDWAIAVADEVWLRMETVV